MTSTSPVSEDPAPAATPPPSPTWVKAFAVIGAIVLVLVLGIVIANVTGFNTEHGPGRHFGDTSDPSPSTEATPTTTAAGGETETRASTTLRFAS